MGKCLGVSRNGDIGTGFPRKFPPMSVIPSAPSPAQNQDFRRTDRLSGLLIVSVAFVLCLVLSAWAKRRSMPVFSAPPAPPTTTGVVGFPSTVDPLKTLPRARELTPRNLLRGITVEGVKSDGTIDVTAGIALARYSFQSAAGEGPEPLREQGTLARRTYCGRQSVELNQHGLVAEADAADAPCPPHPVDPLPEPHCNLADLWAHAVERGVPKERLAHVEYYRSEAGPALHFDARHPRGRFTLYGDCKRELDAKESIAVGP
jgi:hypothetical protein